MKKLYRVMFVITFGLMLIPATAPSPDFSRDPLQWRASLTTNANRLHKDVFPGIDLFYTGDTKTISSVFIVRPEGDPASIRLEFQTATKLETDKSGNVLIQTKEEGVVRILQPNLHQNLNNQNQRVAGKFVRLDDKLLSVQIESYNRSLPLVIQFTSVFSPTVSPTIANPNFPFAVAITATLKDSLVGDAGQIGTVNPGDTLRYIVSITNSGTTDATGMNFSDVLDTSTVSIAGSLKATPVAVNDAYVGTYNATLNVAASGVLTNDYGVPAPTATPIAAGVTPHGTVTLNANGSFAYNPTNGYFGPDTFSYTATNSVGSNTAIAAITIPPPAPVANNDAATASGNIQISVAAPGVLGNDQLFGATITASSSTSAQGGNVTVNADGSYTYNPPAGYEGSDTFTYTITNATNNSVGTVTVTVSGMIWFINNAAGAGDGRLSSPFNSISAFQTLNNGTGNNPAANDNIFIYESGTNYVGPITLLNGQKLIGQDATATLSSISGVAPPSGSLSLPTTNSVNGTIVNITTSVASTNALTLGTGNTIRGLKVGTTTGAKIIGNSFGTLTVGNNTSPDVTLSGNGQALSLTNGTLAATSGFVSVASTSSGTQGIVLSTVGGTASFGSTTISGNTTQGILVSGSTISINFGNTSVNGGTDAISLQNNSSGTRTFGTLTISGNSATGFLHAVGGGTTTVGATTITNPGGTGIDIQSSTTAVMFGATTVNKGSSAGTGVNLGGAASGNTADVTFASLGITASNGTGLLSTNNTGQIIVTTATSAVSATNGPALNISRALGGNTTVNLNFSGLTSAGTATNGVTLINVAGTIVGGTGSLIGSGAVVNVSGGTVGLTYSGNITQANNAALVSISGGHATGTIAFNTGTLSATNGTGLQFDNADGTYNFNGTTTLNGGSAAVNIVNGSGGAFTFAAATAITSPADTAFGVIGGTASVTYSGNITQANNFPMVSVSGGHTTGTITFQTGALSATNGSGLQFDNADSPTSYNFNGTTTLNGGDAGIDIVNGSAGTFSFASGSSITNPTNEAIKINASTANVTYSGSFTKNNNAVTGILVTGETGGTISINGSGTKTISTTTANAINLTSNTGATINLSGNNLSLTTTSGVGFNATGGGTVNVTGTGNTINSTSATALNVANTMIGASNLNFQSISSGNNTAAADPTNGIVLNNTGSSGGLTVTGDGNTSVGGNNSGGTIQSTTGVGISLTNTTSPSFTNMNIQNTTDSGIKGYLVTNFTFKNGTINNSGSGLGIETSNISFNTSGPVGTERFLSGVVTVTDNILTNGYYEGLDIFNYDGTISDANISGNTVTSSTSASASQGSGIRLIAFGSATTIANVTKATIANNTISNFPSGAGIMAQGGNANAAGLAGIFGTPGSGTNIISVTGNRIAGQSAANRIGTQAIVCVVNGKGQGNFNISNNGTVANPLTNTFGTTLAVSCFGQAVVTAVVNNNVIVSNNAVGSQGIGAGTGTTFGNTDAPNLTLTVTNNNISSTDGNGILCVARDCSGDLTVKIQNNTVAAPLGGVRPGIRVDAGNSISIDDDVCLNISGNTSAGSGGSQGIGLRKQGTSSTTNAFGVNGMAVTSSPGVETYINGLNPAGGGTLLISATSGFSNCSFP